MLGGSRNDHRINQGDQRLEAGGNGAPCLSGHKLCSCRIGVEKRDELFTTAVTRLESVKPAEMSGSDNSDLQHVFSWLTGV
ncbi:hypothetical protein AA0535_2338 [Asaia krungthepensis NRIC 0535]|uniref:Uncharacterized protein n=1 Tax=Asaia krungthepensis NRIC 0535 TaxID=1307925 RepID=A0ABQ0Q4Y2_9PROT|nr:hypothetical protein AA0535_2338 [Asaia krungthepensis NRIC 0535]